MYKPPIRGGVSTGCRKKPSYIRRFYMAAFSIHGDIIWSEIPGAFRYFEGGYLTVSDGKVLSVSQSRPDCEIIETDGSLVIPGLSDLHLHAPQYAFAGLYMDEELLDWLNHHTFPEEGKYKDAVYAERAYSAFASDLKKSATTRVSVFGTIHTDSTLLLMEKLQKAGLSGYVGKVNMDRNSPDYLTESYESSVAETERFIESSKRFENLKPTITPRFVPSCTDDLMKELGIIAERYSLPIQSHLDENLSEIDWVKELCPWSLNYADVYRAFGMLNDRTIMAHCVWLNDDEIKLLSDCGTFIAHSPSSNTNLSSGIAPIRKYLDAGIRVGLATDVAGGSSISMFRMIQDAIAVSKLRWRFDQSSGHSLRFAEAFYLATKGGGSYFGKTGSFEPGYDADIVVIDDKRGEAVNFHDYSIPERLEYYTYRHPDQFITSKFVKGRRVF